METGAYLKQLRIEKGYTLNEVADKLNLSASFLSQLENKKISPSLDSLEKILSCYAVTLSDFFSHIEQKKFIIMKQKDEQTLNMPEGGILITALASKLQNNLLETCLVKLNGNAVFETAVLPAEINGERIIYITKGSITAVIDREDPIKLAAGDSVNYKSYVSCQLSTDQGDAAEIFISGMPPLIF